MASFIQIPAIGSADWKAPVATVGDLPISDPVGSIRLVEADGSLRWWDGSAWQLTSSGSSFSPVDTDSIDLTVNAGNLTADLRISSNAADSGKILAALNVESAGSLGLRAQIDQSSSTVDGYLSATDWSTFNGKQNDITAGTVADFYRGDKTMQPLNMAALQASNGNSLAPDGTIGQRIETYVNFEIATAASGTWGHIASVVLPEGSWMITGSLYVDATGVDLTAPVRGVITAVADIDGNMFDGAYYSGIGGYQAPFSIALPTTFWDINASTEFFLNTYYVYSGTAPLQAGQIRAYRIR